MNNLTRTALLAASLMGLALAGGAPTATAGPLQDGFWLCTDSYDTCPGLALACGKDPDAEAGAVCVVSTSKQRPF